MIVFTIALSFVSNSCDDETIVKNVNYTPVNITFSIEIESEGNSNPFASSQTYCLSQSSTYSNYAGKIDTLIFVQAAWGTDSLNNISTGHISITLRNAGGPTLVQKNLTYINPSDYKSPNAPFALPLTYTEEQALEDYLNGSLVNPNQSCLQATVTMQVVTGTRPYYLRSKVDLVVEARIKL